MIARQMLHCTPLFEAWAEPPALYVAGELSEQTLRLDRRAHLYVSASNPGATSVVREFEARYRFKNLTLTGRKPAFMKPNKPEQQRRSSRCKNAQLWRPSSDESTPSKSAPSASVASAQSAFAPAASVPSASERSPSPLPLSRQQSAAAASGRQRSDGSASPCTRQRPFAAALTLPRQLSMPTKMPSKVSSNKE
eukprot:4788913-Prymnesium_polylepis.1